MHKLIPALVIITLLFGATVGSASADTGAPTTPISIECEGGACTAELGLEGVSPLARLGAALGIAALQSQTDALPAGAHLAIDDDLALTLPIGKIVLPKAQLDVELGEGSRIQRLNGTAQLPLPNLAALGDQSLIQPARAAVGLDLGKNLGHLAASLDPEHRYLFFDISSGLEMTVQGAEPDDALSLSAPAGQKLSLIIDTEEPLVYLAGNVNVNPAGELLLAGPLQELPGALALLPDTLLARQRGQVTVAGLAGKEVDDYLKVGGAWSVEAGALGQWLGIQARPLAVQGLVTLSADGVLLDGVVRSSIEPDKLLDSSLQFTLFIPLRGNLLDAFVQARGQVAVPVAHIDADASVRLEARSAVAAIGDALSPGSAQAGAAQIEDKSSAQRSPSALQEAAAAIGRQAANGAEAVKGLAAAGGAWFSTLPKIRLGQAAAAPAQ